MHLIEPYYNWRNHYVASNDPRSPFFERTYNEMSYHIKLYDHFIHPQWDTFGSNTLYLKILFVEYEDGYAILELMGEWNDCLHNDIMLLKRDIIESLQEEGISKFILIGENVLNFHYSDDSYYEEWFDEGPIEESPHYWKLPWKQIEEDLKAIIKRPKKKKWHLC